MPALLLAISLFVLSQAALLIRFAAEAGVLEIGFWRLAFAVPVLVALGLVRGSFRGLLEITPRRAFALAGCGLFLFAHWITWFISVKSTSLANSMVFFAVSPIFTSAGAWFFFREPFERRHFFALALCLAGVVLIFGESLRFVPAQIRGDSFALLSSLLFSGYVLLGKGIRSSLPNLLFTSLSYSCAMLPFAILLASGPGLRLDFSAATWTSLALLALGPTLLGHALFTYCMEHFNVNLMSILVLTEPVMGALVAYFLISEPITRGALFGFCAISAGVSALFLPGLRRARG